MYLKPNPTPEEFKEFQKLALRRARITSIVLGTAAVVAVLSMVYGFTQKIEAGRQRDMADYYLQTAVEVADSLKIELVKCREGKNDNSEPITKP